jgi:prophage regulatory protein
MTMAEVMAATTFSRASVYRLMSEGSFPAPLKLSGNRVAFLASEITAWLNARPRGGAVTRRAS